MRSVGDGIAGPDVEQKQGRAVAANQIPRLSFACIVAASSMSTSTFHRRRFSHYSHTSTSMALSAAMETDGDVWNTRVRHFTDHYPLPLLSDRPIVHPLLHTNTRIASKYSDYLASG